MAGGGATSVAVAGLTSPHTFTGVRYSANGQQPVLEARFTDADCEVISFTVAVQPCSTPNLTINNVTQDEGDAGTTTFTFTVSLSSPAGAGGVTFDIATADGTAQDDNPATETMIM